MPGPISGTWTTDPVPAFTENLGAPKRAAPNPPWEIQGSFTVEVTCSWLLKGERDFLRHRNKEKGTPSRGNSVGQA